MEVYRERRLCVATAHDMQPGISITFKVDGPIAERRGDRNEEGRNIKTARIEDFAYADDTAIAGTAEEVKHAEPVFVSTVSDFAGRVNEHKTEGLRVCDVARAPYDVQGPGEIYIVKHVGAMLAERVGHTANTDRAVHQGIQRVEQVASAWSKGRQIHARRRDLKLSVRIRVLKAIVTGGLFTFVRTRAWQASQIHRLFGSATCF